MDTPTDASPTLFDEAGVIVADTACRRCGYNLRGLHQDGRCPECGTPIGLSTHGDLLRFADPEWVETLAQGLKFVLWGLVLSILFGILGGAVRSIISPAVGQLVTFLAGLLALYGAWLLTVPDPSGTGEDRYVTARKVVRLGLLVGLLHDGGQIFLESGRLPAVVELIVGIAALIAALVRLVGEFAKLFYLEKLALRIPDEQLATRARFLRWAYPITFAVMVVAGAIAAIASLAAGSGAGGASGPFAGAACLGLIGLLALLVFSLMFLHLQYRFMKAFREQAGIARATWAAATAPGQSGLPAAPAHFQHPHEHDR